MSLGSLGGVSKGALEGNINIDKFSHSLHVTVTITGLEILSGQGPYSHQSLGNQYLLFVL